MSVQLFYKNVPVNMGEVLTFGHVIVRNSAILKLSVKNVSDTPLEHLNAEVYEPDFKIEGFPETLLMHEEKDFTVTFTPQKLHRLGLRTKGILRIKGDKIKTRYE